MVLGPAQGLNTLGVAGPLLIDILGNRRRADERDGFYVRVLEQAVDSHLVALNDIKDPSWQSGFGPPLRQPYRG